MSSSIKVIAGMLGGILIGAGLTAYYMNHKFVSVRTNSVTEIASWVDRAYGYERLLIENFPLYEDYTSREKEETLRKYLLKDHLAQADQTGIQPFTDERDIEPASVSGKIVSIDTQGEKLYYFYNVLKKYRFLAPHAAAGLDLVAERFNQNIKKRLAERKKDLTLFVPVKIAISSALRPISYQDALREKNKNASGESSHSYAISFDIFYDDFFLSLPESSSQELAEEILKKIRTRYGFSQGDALKSQLRSILSETLIEMQNEGILYAILERNQKCYHVTILKDHMKK